MLQHIALTLALLKEFNAFIISFKTNRVDGLKDRIRFKLGGATKALKGYQ